MQMKLLDVLACPKCQGGLICAPARKDESGAVISGVLECMRCSVKYPIELGIPRFVERKNYAVSFGYQWNQFKFVQLDSSSGASLSEARWYSETGWTRESVAGKWVLDVGCGAGRFLDVAARCSCDVVGVDLSEAIDASAVTTQRHQNVHLVQASLFELPFRTGVFDNCYCIGVIQHTPDPERALRGLPRVLKAGGKIAVTIYERKPWTLLYAKYLVRPLTRRMNKQLLLLSIKCTMPVLFPLTEIFYRVPYLGRLLAFVLPIANDVHAPGLNLWQRYEWAILDTFDMLSPEYDHPMNQEEGERALVMGGIVKPVRLQNPGLNLVGEKLSL